MLQVALGQPGLLLGLLLPFGVVFSLLRFCVVSGNDQAKVTLINSSLAAAQLHASLLQYCELQCISKCFSSLGGAFPQRTRRCEAWVHGFSWLQDYVAGIDKRKAPGCLLPAYAYAIMFKQITAHCCLGSFRALLLNACL